MTDADGNKGEAFSRPPTTNWDQLWKELGGAAQQLRDPNAFNFRGGPSPTPGGPTGNGKKPETVQERTNRVLSSGTPAEKQDLYREVASDTVYRLLRVVVLGLAVRLFLRVSGLGRRRV